jgi:hypothetical protein
MPRPRFNPQLDILTPSRADPPDLRLSVCAMGPLEEDDEIITMHVWVHQEADGQAAVSTGQGGVHLGGHAQAPSEIFPLKGTPQSTKWMVQTKLDEGSPQFIPGKPALATAMARVKRGGAVEMEQWSQVIMVGPPHQH